MSHTRSGKTAKARRQNAASNRAVINAQFLAHYAQLTPQERLIAAIFGMHETCDECTNSKLVGTDCMTPHCKSLRDEDSLFYDEITNDHITINGATMHAGLDY